MESDSVEYFLRLTSFWITRNSLFANVYYLATSFGPKYRTLSGDCTRTWMHMETKYRAVRDWGVCDWKLSCVWLKTELCVTENWIVCDWKLSCVWLKIELCVTENWVMCDLKLSYVWLKIELFVTENWVVCDWKLSCVWLKIELCVTENWVVCDWKNLKHCDWCTKGDDS